MNKLMKMRLWASVLLLLSIVISIPTVKVSALTNTTNITEENKETDQTETIEETINQDENQIKIIPESKLPLYNMEDEVTAYYYRLETGGYAIANTENGIIEFHFTDDIYNLTKEDKFYYTAPLECYEDVGNEKVKHRFDKKIRRKDSLLVKNGVSNVVAASIRSVAAASTLSVTSAELSKYTQVEKGGITGKTVAYKKNTGNICATIATSIVLQYYYTYESSKYLPVSCNKDEEKTIKLLKGIYTDWAPGNGTNVEDLTNQVNHYLSDRKITKKAKSIEKTNSTAVYNKVKTYTKTKNRVVHISLKKSSGYGEGGHWVVGTGYWTVKITANNASTTARYVQMNDGRGNKGIYINLLHVDGIIYIE